MYPRYLSDKGPFTNSPITRNRSYKAIQESFSTDCPTNSESSPTHSNTPIQLGSRPLRQSRFNSQPSLIKLEATLDNNRSGSKSNSPDSRDAENDIFASRKKTKLVSSLEDIETSSYYQNQSNLMNMDSLTDAQGQNGFKRNLNANLSLNHAYSVQSVVSNILDTGHEEAMSPLKKQANFELKYFWRYPLIKIGGLHGSEPEQREGSTLIGIGRDLYLFGGEKNDALFDDLWKYKPNKSSWKKVICENNSQIRARSGHSAISLKGCMYIFGGELQYQTDSQIYKKVTNELLIYHPNVMRWTIHNTRKGTETVISARKYHAVSVYEQVIMVYGGIGSVGNYLNDVWVFNTALECWKKLPVKRTEFERGGGLAFHAMCAVFGDKGDLGHDAHKTAKPQLEGFYVFGGKNEKGEALNTLQVLTYDHEKKGVCWVQPHIKGIPPSWKYQHTMVHFPETNCLIIYGGRSTIIPKTSTKLNYNDLNVLNLEHMTWVAPKISGDTSIKNRYAHSCSIFSGKMFVFGGKSGDAYLDTGLSILELKANDVEKLQSVSNLSKHPSLKKSPRNSFIAARELSAVLLEENVATPIYYQRKLPQGKSPMWRKRHEERLPSIFSMSSSKWGLASKNLTPDSESLTLSKPHQTVLNFFKSNFTQVVSSIASDILE